MEPLLQFLWQASPLVNPEEREQSPNCQKNQTSGIYISCGLFLGPSGFRVGHELTTSFLTDS